MMDFKFRFIGKNHGNSGHSVICIYRTFTNPAVSELTYYVALEGHARLKTVGIAYQTNIYEQGAMIPDNLLHEACRLMGVEFVGMCV